MLRINGPTCVGLRIQTPADSHVIFHAVHERVLKMGARRLDAEERRAISPGCVYVWGEWGGESSFWVTDMPASNLLIPGSA
jgi:hypothetical protein